MAYRQFKLGKAGNKKIHVAWHTCGVVCVSLALRAVFKPHNVAKSPNLYTAHGIVGLSVVVLFYAQYALAAVSFLSSLSISPPAWRSVLLPWHVVIGIFCYLGSLAAIASGVAEKTAWLGCAYYVHGDKSLGKVQLDRPDINPAQHFGLLPDGCQLGIGVVVSALLAAFLVTLGTLSIKARHTKQTRVYVARCQETSKQPPLRETLRREDKRRESATRTTTRGDDASSPSRRRRRAGRSRDRRERGTPLRSRPKLRALIRTISLELRSTRTAPLAIGAAVRGACDSGVPNSNLNAASSAKTKY